MAKRIVSPVLLVPVIFVSLVLLLGFGLMPGRDRDALPSTRVGQVAPAITALPVLENPTFDQSDLMVPGAKLVNFWASWCAPCRLEHPVLNALSSEIPIYGVNRDVTQGDAQGFLDELGNPFKALVFDPNNRQSIEWGVVALPETFVINGQGEVVFRFAGPITPEILEHTIRPALAEAQK